MSSSSSQGLQVLTVGHSNHAIEHFLELLKQQGVTAICDVRSGPYSRWHPQFDREALSQTLKAHGIEYVFLGKELGARSEDPSCYEGDRVVYSRIAQTELFGKGIRRVTEGAAKYRLALMCAEKEPLECHRSILVAKELEATGIEVQHILPDGNLQSHADAMRALLRREGLDQGQFNFSNDRLESTHPPTVGLPPIEQAYRKCEERIAYRKKIE